MSAWTTLLPVWVDRSLLPEEWELIHDEQLDHYAVIGRINPGRSDGDRIDVVIRIDYAVSPAGADLRRIVGSAVAAGMTIETRRHRDRQSQQSAESPTQEGDHA